MIGTTYGRYRIVAKLGEGGMGSVWRAEDPALGRTVALKLLSSALWASEPARQRFLREARAASQLDHPNISTVYDVGETDGTPWIAYQFIDGETVAARAARGPLPIAEAASIATDVALALAHAHEHHVLHRDVTAGNVMVTPQGRAVLVDFGLARPEGGAQLTSTGMMLGTAGYLAPEVLRGQPADERSDLYGLGAVLYRMVTGRLPFEHEVPEALLYKILNEPVPPPSEFRPELPATLERVVLKLLERNPADRYASAAELAEALREVAPDHGPGQAERTRRTLARGWRRAGEAMRRVGRWRVGVTALGSAALLGAALWLAAQRGWLPGVARKPPTLAVLPFRNETDDPEATAYIADGLAEALATNLAQTERLRVLPWVTTQRARADSTPLPKLAHGLNARRLLMGTIRSTPQGLTVSLSLVDGHDGAQTWSRQFEGTADELPSLEARMLFESATAMLDKLTPTERSRMELPSGRDGRAYNLYLEGASNLSAGDVQSLAIAEQFFKRSLELDSTLAEAHAGLGAVYNSRYFMGIEGGARNFEVAREQFQEAARADSTSPLAMRGLVNIYWQLGRYEDVLKLGYKAARMRPSTLDLRLVAAEAYTLGMLPHIGLQLSEQILSEDPSNPAANFFAVVAAAFSGQDKKVLSSGAAYIRRFGEYYEIYEWLALAASAQGRRETALTLAHRAVELEGDRGDLRVLLFEASMMQSVLGPAAARPTWERLRDTALERLAAEPDQPRNRMAVMEAAAMLGDPREVLEQWHVIGKGLASIDAPGVADNSELPALLLRVGEREQARRAFELVEQRGAGVAAPYRSPADFGWMLTGVQDDPMFLEYRAKFRRRYDELLARYGNP